MSLPEEMDRLSLTGRSPTPEPENEPVAGRSGADEGGTGEPESCVDTDQSAHTPDPSSLRKFVSSSSLFEGDQHLFEFIDEPASKSWPSPPSDLDHFERIGSRTHDDGGEAVVPGTVRDNDDANLSASYNFLDDDESGNRSEKLTAEPCDQVLAEADGRGEQSGSPLAPSPSTCRSTKGRAPPPPTTMTTSGAPDSCPPDCHIRSMSFTEGAGNWQFSIPVSHKTHYHICPEFKTYNYMAYPGSKVRFYQMGYNTNVKKPTENWVRMKSRYHAKGGESARRTHTSHSYSHAYYEHNWLSYAFFGSPLSHMQNLKKYSVPSSWKSRKQFLSHFPVRGQAGMQNFDNSLCMCCTCCNCAKVNQTNCCCCYHCVHTTNSCRRSDVLRMIPFPAEPSTTPGAIVSILKKKGSSSGIKAHDAAVIRELDQSHEQENLYVSEKSHCMTPDSGMRLLSRDEEEGPESTLVATAPSPTLSGPTPITEPTELDMDETKGPSLPPPLPA